MADPTVPGGDVTGVHVANALGSLLSWMGGGQPSTQPGGGTSATDVGSAATVDPFQATPPAPTPTPTTPTTPATTAQGDTSSFPVTQAFGVNGEQGIDLGAPVGTPVITPLAGTVTVAGPDPGGFGNYIKIDHGNGVSTVYGHISGFNVKAGDHVSAGQVIAPSGNAGHSSGPHLEFQVRINDKPVNPATYLAQGWQVLGKAGTSGPTATDLSGSAATPTASAPVTQEDASATAISRLAAVTSGQPDPGSPNAAQPTTPGQPATGQTTGSDSDPNAIGAFLHAIRQHESGGNYQIYNQSGQSNASGAYQFLGSTWKGLGGTTAAAAQASPAEQDAIASRYAQSLFNQFHSWRLVAIAWYGGPGIAQRAAAGANVGAPSGQGSYAAYGDTIARMMAGGK